MTQSQYRTILLLSLGLGLLGGFLDLAVPSLVPDAVRIAQEEYDSAMPTPRLAIALLLGVPSLGLILAATYGLYRFRRWGPRLAVVGTALSLLAWPTFGFSSQSGLAAAFSFLSSYLWGGSVVLCYAAPYRSWFSGGVGAMTESWGSLDTETQLQKAASRHMLRSGQLDVRALVVHEAFVFLAICGVTYGAYALYSLGSFAEAQREEIKHKESELVQHIGEGGVRGLAFRLGQPLFWLVALPIRSVGAALGVAALMVLPAILARWELANMNARSNMSIDTDPHLQEAASPQRVVVRSFSRYAS